MAATTSVLLLVLAGLTQSVRAGCYFPVEFQGEFLTQSMTSREIAYNSVSILFDSVPGWGACHRRLGRHVILSSGGDDNNDGTPKCYKCLSIVSRSPNVLQIHTNGGVDRCHPTEEEARAQCPTGQQMRERRAQEMMLYKTRGFYGGSAITKTYCPINGNYKFTYSINDGTEDDLECNEAVSEASDCPTGYKFDLKFKGCSFPDFEMSFQCLASWQSETQGETYMSLLDTKLPQLGEEARPRYRCALFKEDPETGLTHVALSSDSTCVNNLYSSQDGYETLHMAKEEQPRGLAPYNPGPRHPKCIFPDWMQGRWEGLSIEGGSMVYRDETNFVTYRGKCAMASPEADRYVVHLETTCGEAKHYCALFKQRDANVMEFQLGISTSDEGSDLSLCAVENFSPSKWLTLGREAIEDPPHCPLVGEYTGVIPDADGLCARSYTDCNNPEVMFYTVYSCHNQTEVFEEREYRCFGQWEEPETGLVYTYTDRRDVPGSECFVGKTIDGDRNVIAEAGANCERGHQPEKYGMTLHRQAKCGSSPIIPETIEEFLEERESSNRQQAEEEEEEEERFHESRTFSPKVVNSHRNRHNNKHHKHHNNSEQDIFSNEIPGSSPRSNSGSKSEVSLPVLCAVALFWTLLSAGRARTRLL